MFKRSPFQRKIATGKSSLFGHNKNKKTPAQARGDCAKGGKNTPLRCHMDNMRITYLLSIILSNIL